MAESKKSYTASELAQLAREKYNREEYAGDELDMVEAAVYWALREDRFQHISNIEELKEDVVGMTDKAVVRMYNAGLASAQTAIRETGW